MFHHLMIGVLPIQRRRNGARRLLVETRALSEGSDPLEGLHALGAAKAKAKAKAKALGVRGIVL